MICFRLEEEVSLEVSLSCVKSLIDDGKVNYFNVNRCKLLDDIIQTLIRESFEESGRISVKFIVDAGPSEGAIDAGGSIRKFLRLALACALDSRIFDGEKTS